jgi:hypothetical protein
MFDGLYGFLQVIIILKKAGESERRRFLLCWHIESLAGSTDSPPSPRPSEETLDSRGAAAPLRLPDTLQKDRIGEERDAAITPDNLR